MSSIILYFLCIYWGKSSNSIYIHIYMSPNKILALVILLNNATLNYYSPFIFFYASFPYPKTFLSFWPCSRKHSLNQSALIFILIFILITIWKRPPKKEIKNIRRCIFKSLRWCFEQSVIAVNVVSRLFSARLILRKWTGQYNRLSGWSDLASYM